MNSLKCGRCGASRERQDNYCRSCGHQLTVNLPATRKSQLPVPRTMSVPVPLVGSVAVLALGTGLEWAARRLAGNAARAIARAEKLPAKRNAAQTPRIESATVDEVLYVRKVQLRR